MGFIDYHGTKEDRYGDMVEYAKMQEEREQEEKAERRHMAELAELMGDEKYLSMDAKALLRQVRFEYRAAAELFRGLALKPADDRIDPTQLWKNLWLYTIGQYLLMMGLPEEKAVKLFSALLTKCFELEPAETELRHFRLIQTSRRYRRHMRAFSLPQTADFWKMLYVYGKSKGLQNTVSGFLDAYGRCITCLAYYLCQKLRPMSEEWKQALIGDLDALGNLKELLEQSKHIAPKVVILPSNTDGKKEGEKGPLAKETGVMEKIKTVTGASVVETTVVCWDRLIIPTPSFVQRIRHTRELLFRRREKKQGEENEMIDDLYAYLKETGAGQERISTILPEPITQQLQSGILPVLDDPSVSGLAPGEQIHYMEHGTLFWDEARVEEPFTKVKGLMVITDKRVAFRGARSLDVGYEKLDRVIRYDMSPEILELECDQNSFYVSVPSIESAYQTLKVIANKRAGEPVPEKTTTVDYGTLVEKADISACIFAYECLEAYDLPSELIDRLSLLVKKLNGLKRTLEFHPERKDETERFLSYYIPEGVHLALSYYEQRSVDLPEKTVQALYAKIKDSIDTLDAAVEQKILSIYQFETMDTTAKADALRQILEQDGYFKANQILTC